MWSRGAGDAWLHGAQIEFQHIGAFFVENAPKLLDPSGKVVQLPRISAEGKQAPHRTKVPPGGEVELYEWEFDLDSGWKANHGAGKFTLQCERVVGPTSGNPVHPNPKLDKLATGKLELPPRLDTFDYRAYLLSRGSVATMFRPSTENWGS